MAPEPIEALPVDLVEVADVTDLLAGDKRAEEAPEEPQPTPEVEAEELSPERAEPAERPVEAARAPAPRPEPTPAPEPEPEPQEVAALPEPEPEPEPLPAAEPEAEEAPAPPLIPNLPRARPQPPREVAQPEPEPEPEAESEAAEEAERLLAQPAPDTPEPDFNPDDIAALLNKQQPAGGGAPQPVEEPQTLGSIDGRAEAAMTQSMVAALRARLAQCWAPPVGVREAGNLVVTVRISLLQDGSLAGQPQPMSVGAASNPLANVAIEAAIRAVAQCAPFGPDILQPEKYALWRQIDFTFDPRQMLGG